MFILIVFIILSSRYCKTIYVGSPTKDVRKWGGEGVNVFGESILFFHNLLFTLTKI